MLNKLRWRLIGFGLIGAGLGIFLHVVMASAQQQFVPFTVDEKKVQEINEATARLNAMCEAHGTWVNIFQGMERQAQQERAKQEQPK